MNRVHTMAFRLLVASFLLWTCIAGRVQAQSASSQGSKKPADAKAEKKDAEEDPFAPESAPPLPAGMTGSDANDPRAKLAPGMYNAGEAAMGLKHLLLVRKPDAFQLDSADPANPKVQKTLNMMGVAEPAKLPKSA